MHAHVAVGIHFAHAEHSPHYRLHAIGLANTMAFKESERTKRHASLWTSISSVMLLTIAYSESLSSSWARLALSTVNMCSPHCTKISHFTSMRYAEPVCHYNTWHYPIMRMHEALPACSGTPPSRHPWNAAIYNNADTLLGQECDLHIIKPPEMWPPCYSIKRTLDIAPTVSSPI